MPKSKPEKGVVPYKWDNLTRTVVRAHAIALLSAGKTYREIIAATGLNNYQIKKLKDGEFSVPAPMIQAFRDEEEGKITLLMHRILDSVDDTCIDDASLTQRLIAFGVLGDKRELFAGRPTSRIDHSISDDEIWGHIAEIKKGLVADAQTRAELLEANIIDAEFEEVGTHPAGTEPTA